jgi:hypothetical protein
LFFQGPKYLFNALNLYHVRKPRITELWQQTTPYNLCMKHTQDPISGRRVSCTINSVSNDRKRDC